ncbi:hypothetical protein HYT23_00740 [Candidatus Pacearchaeota archaeon]|nr:hypothetical protein [Candidatus Pacearchaeota archaeon]
MKTYTGAPLSQQDRLKEGLIKIVGEGYLHIDTISFPRLRSFLGLEYHIRDRYNPIAHFKEQDRLQEGLLKYRALHREIDYYGGLRSLIVHDVHKYTPLGAKLNTWLMCQKKIYSYEKIEGLKLMSFNNPRQLEPRYIEAGQRLAGK